MTSAVTVGDATGEKKALTCKELAARISAHLKRFEADKAINTIGRHLPKFYCAGATGRTRVHVSYITFQGSSSLTKAEAQVYLDWLDAGNVGRHHESVRAAASPSPLTGATKTS